jgi:NAD(P)-dependent dehydrogenase (short-subunit alcohol dehydrogenase family)
MAGQRVAIITASGRGIGAACAREMNRRGFSLVLMSPSDSAERLAGELGGEAMRGSVLDNDDLQALVELCSRRYGRIDAVINSTANPTWSATPRSSLYELTADSHLLDIPDEDWHAMLDVVLLSVIRMARLVTPIIRDSGGGSIVNISGLGAAAPCSAYPFGATMRRALTGFAKLYAQRYGPHGIRMNNVLPGFLENHHWSESLLRSIPLQRPGTLEEVAALVGFLGDDSGRYMTGRDLLIDGGVVRDF